MNDPRLDRIPLILETPCDSSDTYAREIALLRSLQKE